MRFCFSLLSIVFRSYTMNIEHRRLYIWSLRMMSKTVEKNLHSSFIVIALLFCQFAYSHLYWWTSFFFFFSSQVQKKDIGFIQCWIVFDVPDTAQCKCVTQKSRWNTNNFYAKLIKDWVNKNLMRKKRKHQFPASTGFNRLTIYNI